MKNNYITPEDINNATDLEFVELITSMANNCAKTFRFPSITQRTISTNKAINEALTAPYNGKDNPFIYFNEIMKESITKECV